MGNIGAGIAIGIAIGAAVGASRQKKAATSDD
jgi:F0F1-type ATP synthase membrane subunit c/vacuolar-type H+-ATPase subunit K